MPRVTDAYQLSILVCDRSQDLAHSRVRTVVTFGPCPTLLLLLAHMLYQEEDERQGMYYPTLPPTAT